ncbi:MAG: hypothetical protein UT18_C0005G0020 [candidate division CPR2 bacterium GW2011_GWC2_39_10]|uniref:Peptidase C51 domain-containing protein n=1 Tax=candidate division CPR2 bacterium GW2011_GWC2_39_10 TaxID=1618345 RepID=A0A0G0M3S1_UNCC2|nr:MAG: hypothetical protein UT18_C0005G0020 [candidate division CPR2 bacterium GW2011_GWC2_39_10]
MDEEENKQIVEDDPLTSDQQEEFEDDEGFDDSGYEDGDYGDGYDEDYSGGGDDSRRNNDRGERYKDLRNKMSEGNKEGEAAEALGQFGKQALKKYASKYILIYGGGAVLALMLIIIVGFAIFGLGGVSDDGDTISGVTNPGDIQGPENLEGIQARIVEIALSQLGVREIGKNGGDAVCVYLKSGGCSCPNPWCAGFVSWVYQQAGATGVRSCSATLLINQFNRSPHQMLDIDSNIPQPGDVIYRSGKTHVGIVYKVDPDGTLYTIEGNTSSGVVKINQYRNYGRNNWSKLGRY